eukprot:1152769-Pelagomonas_calceolata.AAC.4
MDQPVANWQGKEHTCNMTCFMSPPPVLLEITADQICQLPCFGKHSPIWQGQEHTCSLSVGGVVLTNKWVGTPKHQP